MEDGGVAHCYRIFIASSAHYYLSVVYTKLCQKLTSPGGSGLAGANLAAFTTHCRQTSRGRFNILRGEHAAGNSIRGSNGNSRFKHTDLAPARK